MPQLPELETRLDPVALGELLTRAGWTRDGESISKTFRCKGFSGAVAFVDRIGAAANKLNHHPDIHIERYQMVRIVTTTHATKKLSDADVELAHRIDEAYAG